ncbi:hypothetical protein HJG60_011053 [Phyllostomus discolor]|uniref:Uncharacterized protein n=1 Tax=Phyllostomus discolor TaxID=89673 RepID=A0A834AEH0_9CHIR|nr:hypothetical protein HJG60_011053 [Phyllostomus discolor]
MGRTVPWITPTKTWVCVIYGKVWHHKLGALKQQKFPLSGLWRPGVGDPAGPHPRGGPLPWPLPVGGGRLAPLGSGCPTPISASVFAPPSLRLSPPWPHEPPCAQEDGRLASDARPILMIFISKCVVTPAKVLFLNVVTCMGFRGLRRLSSGGRVSVVQRTVPGA